MFIAYTDSKFPLKDNILTDIDTEVLLRLLSNCVINAYCFLYTERDKR